MSEKPKNGLGCRLSSVWQIAKHTWKDVVENELLTRANGIAFTAMMAAVPFLALVITIAAMVLPAAGVEGRDLLRTLETLLGTVFPEDAHRVIEEQITRLQTNQPIAVVSISLCITVYLASGLFASVIDGLNRIYGIRETRPYWKFRLTAIWMTIVQSVILLAAVASIFAFPLIVNWLGVNVMSPWMATAATWFIIFLMVLASFALMFAAGPDVKQAHRWVTPGSVFGALIFLGTTYGFRLYVQNIAHYDVTYGSLGGVMMLMFWLYISSLVLLVAGQVNKVMYKAREWTTCEMAALEEEPSEPEVLVGNPEDSGIIRLPTASATQSPADDLAAVEDRIRTTTRRSWHYCPHCAHTLCIREVEPDYHVLACSKPTCTFVDWNNPVPVVAALILKDSKVVLVRRRVAPFVGRWCLPRGYVKTNENPKAAVVREVRQETGLLVLLKRMLNACNPSPRNMPLNQLTMFYLATILDGQMAAGDDADEVGLFSPDALPDICFGTDTRIIEDWFAGVHGQLESPVNFRHPKSVTAGGAKQP